MIGKPDISFVILSYNEEQNLENTVVELLCACEKRQEFIGQTEIILVNDGSTDATATIIEKLVRRHSNVRDIQHPTNRGLGAAFKSGARAAMQEWVFWLPGENTVPSDTIASILPDRRFCRRPAQDDSLARGRNRPLFPEKPDKSPAKGRVLSRPVRALSPRRTDYRCGDARTHGCRDRGGTKLGQCEDMHVTARTRTPVALRRCYVSQLINWSRCTYV